MSFRKSKYTHSQKQSIVTRIVSALEDGENMQDALAAAGIDRAAFFRWINKFTSLQARYETYKKRGKKKNSKLVLTKDETVELVSQIIRRYPFAGMTLDQLCEEYGIVKGQFYKWRDEYGMSKEWQLSVKMAKHNTVNVIPGVGAEVTTIESVSNNVRMRCFAALEYWLEYFAEAVTKWEIDPKQATKFFTKSRAAEAAGITINDLSRATRVDPELREAWKEAAKQRNQVINAAKADLITEMRLDALSSLNKLVKGWEITDKKESVKIVPKKLKKWDATADNGKGAYIEYFEHVEETSKVDIQKQYLPDLGAVRLLFQMTGDYTPREQKDINMTGEVVLGIMGTESIENFQQNIENDLEALKSKKDAMHEDRSGAGSQLFSYTDAELIEEDGDTRSKFMLNPGDEDNADDFSEEYDGEDEL